jgi:hypothetical protein
MDFRNKMGWCVEWFASTGVAQFGLESV